MKPATLLPVIFALLPSPAFARTEPERFAYNISGKVYDEKSRPMPQTRVCFVPAIRPINGRIPCTRTDDKGSYDFTVWDIPDNYMVCASTSESVLVLVGDTHRVACSKRLVFGDRNQSRRTTLKFKAKGV